MDITNPAFSAQIMTTRSISSLVNYFVSFLLLSCLLSFVFGFIFHLKPFGLKDCNANTDSIHENVALLLGTWIEINLNNESSS